MKLDEIIDMWQKDCKIDETELARESVSVPELHGKYLKLYSNQRLRLKNLKLKRGSLRKSLIEYYKGDLNTDENALNELNKEPIARKILKGEIADYVDNDSLIVDINIKIAYKEEIVDTLKEIIDSINRRGFAIKNAIDFLKFTNGEF